jgi:hypothetical protein
MADVQHKDIIDPNIHEPKGVNFAAANTAYIADGAGSGSWQEIVIPGTENSYPSSAFTVDWDSGTANLSSNILIPCSFVGPTSNWGDLDITVSEGFLEIGSTGIYLVTFMYDVSVFKDSITPAVVNTFSVRPTKTKLTDTALDGLFLPALAVSSDTAGSPVVNSKQLCSVVLSLSAGQGIGFWGVGTEDAVARITNATLDVTLRITRLSNA